MKKKTFAILGSTGSIGKTSLNVINDLLNRRGKIKENMIELKQLKLPEQRSIEWYAIRENLLTASSLADALGKGHFQTRDGLLISKTSEKSNKISQASRGFYSPSKHDSFRKYHLWKTDCDDLPTVPGN